jgi:type II secretory pathway component GspD/PulD (secretin)
MKIKTTVLVIGLATSGLVSCLAQDNNNNPPPQPAPAEVAPANPNPAQPAPAEVTPGTPAPANPATPAPAVTPAPAGTPAPTVAPAPAEAAQGQAAPAAADKTDAAPAAPVNPNDPVPLIVIDEVPLTDAIRNLARQSNLNFQFDPRITMTNQPNVSIRFENVSAQEALTAVLENYNLVLVKEPKSKIARITIKDPKAEDPLVSRIIQLKYSDPTNLVALVKSTLSPRSTVVADARTSQLIVTTTEKEQDAVVILVTTLDTPTKQVLIEGNLLETSRNPSTIKGIDWAGTLEAQSFSFGNNLYAPPSAQSLNNLVTVPPTPRLLVDTAKGFNPATAFLDADGVVPYFRS